MSDILAEVKTLRSILAKPDGDPGSEPGPSPEIVYTAMRFMLDERKGEYTKFVEILFGDLDLALGHTIDADTAADLIEAAGCRLTTLDTIEEFKEKTDGLREDKKWPNYASYSGEEGWALMDDGNVLMNVSMLDRLNRLQRQLRAKLNRGAKSEPDGTDQPATAPESKSESEEKPKPESDGRSQERVAGLKR